MEKTSKAELTSLDFDFQPICELIIAPVYKRPNGTYLIKDEEKVSCHNVADHLVVYARCCDRVKESSYACGGCLHRKMSKSYLVCQNCGTKHEPPSAAYQKIIKL